MFQQAASCCFRSLHQLPGQNQLQRDCAFSFFCATDPLKAPPSVLLFPAHCTLGLHISPHQQRLIRKKAETCAEAAKMVDDDEKKNIGGCYGFLPPDK
jgi:hypothetical protein